MKQNNQDKVISRHGPTQGATWGINHHSFLGGRMSAVLPPFMVLLFALSQGLWMTAAQAQEPLPVVTFKSATFIADQLDANVTVVMTCSAHTGPVTVNLSTQNGTANDMPPISAATAGTDYTALTNHTVTFEANVTEMPQVISLVKMTGKVANRRFTVALTDPVGATLGGASSASVRIAATDTVKPTLSITALSDKAKLSTLSPYMLSGNAGDVNGIDRVEVSLNNGAPVPASLTIESKTKVSKFPWALCISPNEGQDNTVTVTAYDLHGNKTELKRTFNFTRRYQLTVNRSLAAAGVVSLSTSPSSAATRLIAPQKLSLSQTSQIVTGSTVKLKATPLKDYVFSHWTLPVPAPAEVVNLGNELSFTMPVADVSIAANFIRVDSIFISTPARGNTYHGLIVPREGVAVSNNSVGSFTGTLVPTTGAISGKLVLGGVTTPFKATIFGNGSVVFNQASKRSRTLKISDTRSLSLLYTNVGINVNVSEAGSLVVTGVAERAFYNGTTAKVPAAKLSRTTPKTPLTKGVFNVALNAKAQNPVVDTHLYPQGSGLGVLTLGDNGTLTFAGSLADGSTFTASSALVTESTYPFFAQLITPGAASSVKGGSLSGQMTVDPAQANTDVAGIDLRWIRPAVAQITGTTPAALATQLYTAGWPTGIRLDAVGTFYDKSQTLQTTLVLDGTSPSANNSQLQFTSPELLTAITVKNFAIIGNTVTKISKTDKLGTLRASAATGLFSGTFTPSWESFAKAPAFKGILLQKGADPRGYGYFISNAKDALDPESGNVTLGKVQN